MVIYIDILFFINLFMNYIIFFGTVKMSKQTTTILRIIISTVLSALYSCLIFIEEVSFIYSPYIKFVFSIILILILFKTFNLKQLLRNLVYFYIVTFLIGGTVTAVLYFTDFGAVVNSILTNNTLVFGINIRTFIFSGILVYFLIFLVSNIKQKNYKKFKVIANGKSIDLIGLVDSGNLLYEPVSKLPVFIVERKRLELIFTKKYETKEEFLEDEKFKVIYFKSLGQENGEIIVFPAEAILDNVIFRVYIGIYEGQLNKNYQAIIHLIN